MKMLRSKKMNSMRLYLHPVVLQSALLIEGLELHSFFSLTPPNARSSKKKHKMEIKATKMMTTDAAAAMTMMMATKTVPSMAVIR